MAGSMRGWGPLLGYTVLLYAAIPFTSTLGLAFVATPIGGWIVGRGLVLGVLVGAGIVLGSLRRSRAPWVSYAGVGVTAVVCLWAFRALAARPLERVHIPEYGLAAWLAWRAMRPRAGREATGFAAAFALAALIGWGEELIQSVTPTRYFAWHDVGVNALGAALGLLTLASLRAACCPSAPADATRSRPPCGSDGTGRRARR